jgi:hypothetical protein
MVAVSGKLVARSIFYSTPSGTKNFLEATLRRRRILATARHSKSLHLHLAIADEISRTKGRTGSVPLTRQALDIAKESRNTHEKPGPGYIIGKDVNTNKILFANGTSVSFVGPCPLSNLSRRHGWPTPSFADLAFIESCEKRLRVRLSQAVERYRRGRCYD